MRRSLRLILGITIFSLFLIEGCKKKEDPLTSLTVQCSPGVAGTPQAGTFQYKPTDIVNYSFTAMAGYKNLKVTLDGHPVSMSGSVSMADDHLLAASTERILYLTGNWNISVLWTENNCSLTSMRDVPCIGTQTGDDITALIHTPEGDLQARGKIDLNGLFNLEGTIGLGAGLTRKYSGTGKMSGETDMLGSMTADTFQDGNMVCTSNGLFMGKKT